MPFRTRTGQTGRAAYVNELAAIQNAQRELDARAARLADAIATEMAGDTRTYPMPIPSEGSPDATIPAPLSHTAEWVRSHLYDDAMHALQVWPSDPS
jgi:hypothetical protein